MKLRDLGYEEFRISIPKSTIETLRECAFFDGEAGTRCLLDHQDVRSLAIAFRTELTAAGRLPPSAVAIQAIAFDKTPATNRKVAWHQDVMFPFAKAVTHSGFELPSRKDGVDYARPPRAVLEDLLAVRFHLDECDNSNGPLRVSPGSHSRGIIRSSEIADEVARHGEAVCLAEEGSAILIKPLLLHASSPATSPSHRRVLHFVFRNGAPMPEVWFRAV